MADAFECTELDWKPRGLRHVAEVGADLQSEIFFFEPKLLQPRRERLIVRLSRRIR